MINGRRVRDSGFELSPTGTDRRGGPKTASNRTVRASSAIAAGSTRLVILATFGHSWRNGHRGWPPRYISLDISVAGPLATMATQAPFFIRKWPMAAHGNLFIRKWPMATH